MNPVVVADAGPLNYLILIGFADVLENLFDQVLIPTAVWDELLSNSAPEKVKAWMSQPRGWLEVCSVGNFNPIGGLHRGENEALQLALERQAAGVLIDDLDGRKTARSMGLTVIGTVGLLERAAEKELLVLSEAIRTLRQTNFFISEEILDAALERDRLRRGWVC